MSCQKPTPCPPCADPCGATPDPVMPRCDIVLPDGVYTNATVVVENGCIIAVTEGEPFLYQPDSCCATPGGGGSGGTGPQGPIGPQGLPATVSAGTVATTAPGTPATVTNVGTASNAIFNFTIPRGEPGANGTSPSGLTVSTAGIEFVNGALQSLPVQWPPLMLLTPQAVDVAGVTLTQTKDNSNGNVVLTLSMAAYDTALRSWVTAELAQALVTVQTQIDALALRMTDAEARLDVCCP